jgi:hypothetical protein
MLISQILLAGALAHGGGYDWRLEQAVRQLQDEVDRLRTRVAELEMQQRPSRPADSFACSLTTSFRGTFFANAPSRLEATAKTLKKCEAAGEPFCRKEEVQCEHSF